MSEKEKLRILPIVNKLNIVHLFSKIGLSNTFAENGINTPNYFVANNEDDIIKAFCSFKGGFFIKLDSSGGGLGVFPCDSRDQFEEIKHKIAFPVLVQEKIEGDLIDLSGFFQNGKLVYFGYAEILESRPDKFGPSVLRRYHKLSGIDVEIFDRLGELGQALGANGFVNIGSVRSAEDGKIYFIEADMRPTAWVEHQKFFEEDPAVRIKDYFLYGRTLSRDDIVGDMTTSGAESTIVIPYFHRMDRCEIIENKYNCHSFRTDYLDKKVEKWWHRPLAELFLTLGRVFHVGTVRTIGDRIWDTYIE